MNNTQAQAVKNSVFRIRTQSFRAQSIERKNEMRAQIAAEVEAWLQSNEITVLPTPEYRPLLETPRKPLHASEKFQRAKPVAPRHTSAKPRMPKATVPSCYMTSVEVSKFLELHHDAFRSRLRNYKTVRPAFLALGEDGRTSYGFELADVLAYVAGRSVPRGNV